MNHALARQLVGAGTLATACLLALPARAQGARFAVPPPPDGPYELRPARYEQEEPPAPTSWERPESPLRLSIGPAGRASGDELRPGLYAAVDFGSGPAGFRVSGTWVRIGYDDPLAQYTGELTLDFGRGALHPVLGVGAGLARVKAEDPTTGAAASGGANLGIGVARAGLDYRFFPRDDVDARIGIGIVGALPVTRADDAPKLDGWGVVVATMGIGL